MIFLSLSGSRDQGQTGVGVAQTGVTEVTSGVGETSGIGESGVAKVTSVAEVAGVAQTSISKTGISKTGIAVSSSIGEGGGKGSNGGEHMDGGGLLLGGQTTGGGILKGSVEGGLGGGYILGISKVALGDLGLLDAVVDGCRLLQGR